MTSERTDRTGDGVGPPPGYWPSPWPAEDGGPRRLARPTGLAGPSFGEHGPPRVTHRDVTAATMVVLRDPGEVLLLRHTAGDGAVSWVERVDPVSLEPVARSEDLAGGPTWPGGLGVLADGSVVVVFGRHAHRLDADLRLVATTRLPRERPYNSFVALPDGTVVTKDFGGVLPGGAPDSAPTQGTEMVALHPGDLRVLGTLELPEPSIARLSADGDDLYVVGTSTLFRVRWDGTDLVVDDGWSGPYRTLEGQTYGWDPVIALGAVWFLDDGEGSEAYTGTLRGHGRSAAPLHIVRVDLASGEVTLTEVCGRPGGLIANPPLIDEDRRIAVGYDSGNGVLAAFDIGGDGRLTPRWSRDQDRACHPLLFPDTGELLTTDHDVTAFSDRIVVLDIATGEERARVDSGSPVQSVLFGAPGWDRDLYLCSFTTLSRVQAVGRD
jgi:hypothetical protein